MYQGGGENWVVYKSCCCSLAQACECLQARASRQQKPSLTTAFSPWAPGLQGGNSPRPSHTCIKHTCMHTHADTYISTHTEAETRILLRTVSLAGRQWFTWDTFGSCVLTFFLARNCLFFHLVGSFQCVFYSPSCFASKSVSDVLAVAFSPWCTCLLSLSLLSEADFWNSRALFPRVWPIWAQRLDVYLSSPIPALGILSEAVANFWTGPLCCKLHGSCCLARGYILKAVSIALWNFRILY